MEVALTCGRNIHVWEVLTRGGDIHMWGWSSVKGHSDAEGKLTCDRCSHVEGTSH